MVLLVVSPPYGRVVLDDEPSVVLLGCEKDQLEVEVVSVPVVLPGCEKDQLEVDVVSIPAGLELVEET